MRQEIWFLAACVGCSSSGTTVNDATTVSDTARSLTDAATLPNGVYATITGGEFAGTYALTQTVQCNVDVETNAYRFFGGDGHHDLSLFARMQPQAGQMESSPDFWVIVTDDDDQHVAYYPQDTRGGCVVTVDQSWPVARAHFSCTGGAFSITHGIAICPAS